MFIFLFIIINRIYFYDENCFQKVLPAKDCHLPPECNISTPLWHFKKQKCVPTPTPISTGTPTPPPTGTPTPAPIGTPTPAPTGSPTNNPVNEGDPPTDAGAGTPPGTPVPTTTRVGSGFLATLSGQNTGGGGMESNQNGSKEKLADLLNRLKTNRSQKKQASSNNSDYTNELEEFMHSKSQNTGASNNSSNNNSGNDWLNFGDNNTDNSNNSDNNPTTENFSVLDHPEKIDLKSNFKDVGNNSYKAETLMNNLENYLMTFNN